MKPTNYNFLTYPGMKRATLYFETSEGHFYRDMKCVDHQFFRLGETIEDDVSLNQAMGCQAKLGSCHNHGVVPRKCVELATLRWDCILRALLYAQQETILESVEFTIASWPHELPISPFQFYSKFHQTFTRYRKEFKEGSVFFRNFLNQHGEDQLARFRQLLLQPQPYWPSPIPVGPGG